MGIPELPHAYAYDYHGRIMTGAYVSNETFAQVTDQGLSNDFATISTRFYLEVSRFISDWQVVADVRDKYDFFDKLNKELLALTGANTPQLRQLSITIPEKSSGPYANLGRFPVTNAGAVYVDGGELGYRFNPEWSASVFGGENPKLEEQTYVQYNPGCQVYGAYLLYQPNYRNWGSSFYFTNAFASEINYSELDRRYWYENLVYQPSPSDRLILLSYLDFVPRTYFTNGNFNYSHDFSEKVAASAGFLAIDAIEYFRNQGVRETLAPSPYREASLRAQYRFSNIRSLDLITSQGVRLADDLFRHEYLAQLNFTQFGKGHYSGYLGGGWRHEFTSNDVLAKLGGGYYSDKFELTLDATLADEHYESGDVLTPITLELGTAFYFSRSVYGTFSFQEAKDQRVNIISTFFKLSYRFGTKEIPPLRDGAPPRGRI